MTLATIKYFGPRAHRLKVAEGMSATSRDFGRNEVQEVLAKNKCLSSDTIESLTMHPWQKDALPGVYPWATVGALDIHCVKNDARRPTLLRLPNEVLMIILYMACNTTDLFDTNVSVEPRAACKNYFAVIATCRMFMNIMTEQYVDVHTRRVDPICWRQVFFFLRTGTFPQPGAVTISDDGDKTMLPLRRMAWFIGSADKTWGEVKSTERAVRVKFWREGWRIVVELDPQSNDMYKLVMTRQGEEFYKHKIEITRTEKGYATKWKRKRPGIYLGQHEPEVAEVRSIAADQPCPKNHISVDVVYKMICEDHPEFERCRLLQRPRRDGKFELPRILQIARDVSMGYPYMLATEWYAKPKQRAKRRRA